MLKRWPEGERGTADSRQDREERKERHASATPSVLLRLFEKTFSMPWKFRIFNRSCRRWTQMEQPDESPNSERRLRSFCAPCAFCVKWIEGFGCGSAALCLCGEGCSCRPTFPDRNGRKHGKTFSDFLAISRSGSGNLNL
jgi:hypothetical protein